MERRLRQVEARSCGVRAERSRGGIWKRRQSLSAPGEGGSREVCAQPRREYSLLASSPARVLWIAPLLSFLHFIPEPRGRTRERSCC
uniref:Uncharacterized protein n=1 Tax=Engystomops pustulosus TaxID=76066 RepID=A0AAV6YS37_ENGPU|nr:hypothetical protein GDO81_022404 [Engystomops pustulosus]